LLLRRRDSESASRLDAWISDLEAAFADRVLAVTAVVANRWAELMVPNPIPVIDGLLAATALAHDLTLRPAGRGHPAGVWATVGDSSTETNDAESGFET
jgi:hypothetical protein